MRVSVVAVCLLVLLGCSVRTAEHPAATERTPSAHPHVRVHELVGQPVSVVDVSGRTWTALYEAGSIAREGESPIAVDGFPSDLVATPFGVWAAVVNGPRGYLVRYDQLTGERDLAVRLAGRGDTSPEQLAYADGRLWVIDTLRQELVAVDAASGETLRRTVVDIASLDVAAEGRNGFVVADGVSSLVRVTAPRDASGRWALDGVREVCAGPSALAVQDDDAWIACTSGDTVVNAGARRFESYSETDLEHPDRVVIDDDHVLVALGDGPSVAVLDREDGHVLRTVELADEVAPKKPLDAVVSGPDLVVVDPGTDRSYSVPLAILYSDEG